MRVFVHWLCTIIASGSWSLSKGSIRISRLDDQLLVRTLYDDGDAIMSMLVIKSDGKQILVSGHHIIKIKLWNVETYECIDTIDTNKYIIRALNVIECDGKVFLVIGSYRDTITIWDLESKLVIKEFDTRSCIYAMAVFMKEDQVCLATSDYYLVTSDYHFQQF